jgi:hypothetical protein
LLFGLEGIDVQRPKKKISVKDVGKLRVRLDEVSVRYDEVWRDKDSPNAPTDYKTFIDFSRRHTTNANARIYRTEFVFKKLLGALS